MSPNPPTPNPRRLATRVVSRVLDEGAYSHIALDQALTGAADMPERDRRLATELVYGTLTWKRQIDAILAPNVKRGLERLDAPLRAILRVAVYQLGWLRVPDHAAVNEAVKDSRRGRNKGASGLINGVLRSVLRQRQSWPKAPALDKDPTGHIAHECSLPDWLAGAMVKQFGPQEALALAKASNERPGIALRVTGALEGLQERRGALAQALGGQLAPYSPGGVRLERLDSAAQQALAEGRAVVQDEGAQLVSWLAGQSSAGRILDGCAGLGGKTTHLAQLANHGAVIVAVDDDAPKLKVLQRTFKKLALPAAKTVCGDLRTLDIEALGGTFDTVLIDAPCSGLGVLRRHPEIRWHRKADDVAALARTQAELLDRAARLLVPGGQLIYSVCTFTEQEGPDQIKALLERSPELSLAPPPQGASVPWQQLTKCQTGWMALPHLHHTDGFFMSRLVRAQA